MKDKLAGRGITIDFMAEKYKEWINAKKWKGSMTEPDKVVNDYETQLKAKDDINRNKTPHELQEPLRADVESPPLFDL